MTLRIVRFLLWLIRRFGFALNTPETLGIYQWVYSRSGAFDHWLYTPKRINSIASTLRKFGFWRLVWSILRDSELLTGGRRWVHRELVRLRSEQYFCSPPLRDEFAAHVLAKLVAAEPKGDVLAQTAAAYWVADAMMAARLRVGPEPSARRRAQPLQHQASAEPMQINWWPVQTFSLRFHFSGDTVKQTIDGLRQLLSLWCLQVAIAVLPKERKQELVKHVRSYIQELISKDTI